MSKSDFFTELNDIEVESSSKRPICETCMRPVTVCWCPFLPREPLQVETKVLILQHRYEEKRRLKTAPMLQQSLEKQKCTILKGSRFSLEKYSELKEIAENENTMLLYPSAVALDLNDCVADLNAGSCTLVLLDGTWPQAKGIYMKNPWLQKIKQVKLSHNETSKYVIRTQPTENSLSTLESAAVALSILENRPDILVTLVQPLRGMCEYQIQHGAVEHQSKQYLIENGLYKKQEIKPWDKVGRSRPRFRPKKTDKSNLECETETCSDVLPESSEKYSDEGS